MRYPQAARVPRGVREPRSPNLRVPKHTSAAGTPSGPGGNQKLGKKLSTSLHHITPSHHTITFHTPSHFTAFEDCSFISLLANVWINCNESTSKFIGSVDVREVSEAMRSKESMRAKWDYEYGLVVNGNVAQVS